MKKYDIKKLLCDIKKKMGWTTKGKKIHGKTRKSKQQGKRLFVAAAKDYIRQVEGIRSSSTIQNYMTALRSLQEFLRQNGEGVGTERLGLHEINAFVVERYDHWLQRKGLKQNTRSCYLRSLRALYHAIIPERRRKENPFCHVFTGNAATEKRAMDVQTIARLQQLPLSAEEESLELSRDIFLFCIFAMGMPFVDVYHLKYSQIKNGCIVYHRQKTGQQVKVRVEGCMQDIMEKYRRKGKPHIFPLSEDYALALNRYNRHLHRLAVKAQIEQNITSYVARHTWATLAYQEHIAVPVISEGMGHTDTHTTDIYIKRVHDTQLWKANRKVLSRLHHM